MHCFPMPTQAFQRPAMIPLSSFSAPRSLRFAPACGAIGTIGMGRHSTPARHPSAWISASASNPRRTIAGASSINHRPTTSNPPKNYQNATKCYHGLVASRKGVWPQIQGNTRSVSRKATRKTCGKLPNATIDTFVARKVVSDFSRYNAPREPGMFAFAEPRSSLQATLPAFPTSDRVFTQDSQISDIRTGAIPHTSNP